jgi:hypothetical protein
MPSVQTIVTLASLAAIASCVLNSAGSVWHCLAFDNLGLDDVLNYSALYQRAGRTAPSRWLNAQHSSIECYGTFPIVL